MGAYLPYTNRLKLNLIQERTKTMLKEKAKKTFNDFKTMAATEIINIRTGNFNVNKGDAATVGLSTAATAMFYTTNVAFAAVPAIFTRAKTYIGTYYTTIFGITTGLAILLCLLAFLWAMLSPSGRGSERAFGWAKRIILCWLVINCLGGILKIGEDITKSEHYSTSS